MASPEKPSVAGFYMEQFREPQKGQIEEPLRVLVRPIFLTALPPAQ